MAGRRRTSIRKAPSATPRRRRRTRARRWSTTRRRPSSSSAATSTPSTPGGCGRRDADGARGSPRRSRRHRARRRRGDAGWKRTDAPQPEFKALADPHGLMNPGKLRARATGRG
ncbi:MAG: hypothetical protein F9K43_06165 [Bauldia sp.]|nr:MAG: hypothetical protein F9K43_06165 [Bauldia sp.]